MAQQTRLGISGFPRSPQTFLAKTPPVIVTVPGVEYTLQTRRLHYTAMDRRSHYTVESRRTHYTAQDRRSHYTVESRRMHYTVREEDE